MLLALDLQLNAEVGFIINFHPTMQMTAQPAFPQEKASTHQMEAVYAKPQVDIMRNNIPIYPYIVNPVMIKLQL